MSADQDHVSPVDLPALAAELEQLLKLRSIPFAMQLFKDRAEMEAIPRIRRPQAVHTLDQVVGQASRLGWTVGITAEDLVGAQCRAVVGLGSAKTEEWKSGRHMTGVWFETETDASAHQAAMHCVPDGQYDALAVGPFTNRIAYLEEGDYVAIDHDQAVIFDARGQPVRREMRTVAASAALVEKGNYRHFMEKEIHDQPEGCQRTIAAYVDTLTGHAAMPGGVDFAALQRIQIVACGTSYIAGLLGKYMIEQLADLPVDVEIASEFRYREPALVAGSLVIAMSQSGETADTLAALRYCMAKGMTSAAVVNAQESTMAREVDVVWPIHCGPEIGVASTKAFTAQTSVLTALAIAAARARGRIDDAEERRLVKVLLEAPRLIAESINLEDSVKAIAGEVSKARDVLFLGRGPMYPLALEGALKLKEISYIHAEGYAAGELKHGPIALVDEQTPIVILAPFDSYFEKSASNMSEVMARGGQVVFITDPEGESQAPKGARVVVTAPRCDPLIAPLVMSAPIQLLAYYVAVQKGADVDQPRNLAKSVTVE